MRARRTAYSVLATASLLVIIVGCASFSDQHASLIKIESSRNPAKAQRLTLAGVNALENGEPEYAAEKLLSAIRADPQYGPAHNNLGLLQFDDGKLYEAVLSFERARELMPTDPAVYYNLGLVLEKAGKKNQALEFYRQAVEIDPTEAHFLGNLVRLRRRLDENGPDVVAQLQDLMLIETRPDWRAWASEQLELALNPNLDRGPKTPDFGDSESTNGRMKNESQNEPQTRVIDLSPDAMKPGSSKSTDQSKNTPELLPRGIAGALSPGSHFADAEIKNQQEQEQTSASFSRPIPIRSEGAFNTLPQSISDSTDGSPGPPSDAEDSSVDIQPDQ
ncbi:MAG: hypothetical protein CBE00_08060 [Planctomycetaceae bacterium TMED240]|nr:hypothetical protein [Rhodopirellula sp.]OUX06287.1 MAG: hypothetical protein CBE00_08060 [Planctomycetaceae bacterium TMED240]